MENRITIIDDIILENNLRIQEIKNQNLRLETLKANAVINCGPKIRMVGNGPTIKDVKDAYEYLKPYTNKEQEQMIVMYLDTNDRLMDTKVIALGSINTVKGYAMDIFYPAIEMKCGSIIIAHNHPGGNESLSIADDFFYATMERASECVEIPIKYSIVISENGYSSYKDKERSEEENTFLNFIEKLDFNEQ